MIPALSNFLYEVLTISIFYNICYFNAFLAVERKLFNEFSGSSTLFLKPNVIRTNNSKQPPDIHAHFVPLSFHFASNAV